MTRGASVYLDYAATTPVDPRVARAMQACLGADGIFGNPASATHAFGRAAAARVAAARASVAGLIGARPEEIIFTSGATESNNLALLGLLRPNRDRGRHLVSSRTEHKAVIDPVRQLEREGFAVSWITPDRDGTIDPEALRAALRPDTLLVSLMHVNNEIGVVADIGAIAAICRERNVLLHTDASQSVGRLPVDVHALGADLLSFTAHKLYGPKGIGALWVGERARPWLKPILFGGGHEQGLRSGTLATHQIAGFGAACDLAAEGLEAEALRQRELRERLWAQLEPLGALRNGRAANTVAAILSVSFEGVEGESLLAALGGLAVASGSACTSATAEPSYVLTALGRRPALAQSSLRLSLGRPTTAAEIDLAAAAVTAAVKRLRAVANGTAPEAQEAREAPEAPAAPEAVVRQTPQDAFDPLSAETRRLFEELPGAGSLGFGDGERIEGAAGGEAAEAWVQFQLAIAGDTVKDARFRAWGCPHTLAAAAWVASQLPGRRRGDLSPGPPEAWRRQLAAPVEKLGRLFVVEDALQNCLKNWTLLGSGPEQGLT